MKRPARGDRRPRPQPPRWVRAREKKARVVLYASVAFSLFLIVVSVVGDGGIYDTYQLWKTNQAKKADIAQVTEENLSLKKRIDSLQHDPHAVEKIAREKLGLVKPGETVYLFVPPSRKQEQVQVQPPAPAGGR